MSEKKIILHFGFHKTASTSIQTTLAANKEILASSNYSYPRICKDKPHNHNTPILSLFSSEPEKRQIHTQFGRSVDEIRLMNIDFTKSLVDSFSFPGNIILSAEGGSLLTKSELVELKKFFENYELTPQVIIFVRTPLEFITSWASQRIKNGRYINEGNLFFARAGKIAELIDVFGENVKFFPFKVTCKHDNGPVGFFLSELGITNQTQIKFKSSNISFSNQAIRIINDLNKKNASLNKNDSKQRISQADIKRIFKAQGDKYQLTIEEVTPILSKLEDENSLIEERLGTEFCDKKLDYEKLQSISNPDFLKFEATTMKSLSKIYPTLKPHVQNSVMKYISKHSTHSEHELINKITSSRGLKNSKNNQTFVDKFIDRFKNAIRGK